MNYWHKQTSDSPLYKDLIWSKPETKRAAGKLLIIGGNSFGFSAVGAAYAAADKTGVGMVRIVLPDALKKTAGLGPLAAEFAPSNPSGSFSQKALDTWLEHAAWADGVLIAGDLARNSETAIVLEKLLQKYGGQVTITKDGVDYITSAPKTAIARTQTCLVLSLSQLQRLTTALSWPTPVTFTMGVPALAELLHDLTQIHPISVITKYDATMLVATKGQVSTTPSGDEPDIWRVDAAGKACVWWLQNPTRPFEALTTSIIE